MSTYLDGPNHASPLELRQLWLLGGVKKNTGLAHALPCHHVFHVWLLWSIPRRATLTGRFNFPSRHTQSVFLLRGKARAKSKRGRTYTCMRVC